MAHPMTTQINLELAGALRRLGKNIPFQIKVDSAPGGFCEASCVDEQGNPVEGVEPIFA